MAPRELTAEELEAKLAREEEEKQMTLDEWKAKQAKKEGPKFNLRKAGEGSDVDPKWKKATAYKKENEEEDDEEEEEAVVYLQRSTRQKKLDINFTFADQGGRGGGDRGRGGRGRGEGRGRGGRGRVMVKDVHPTGSAAKVRRVNAAHRGSPGSQDQMERKASSSRGEGEVKEAE